MDKSGVILMIEDSDEDYQTAKRLLREITEKKLERFSDGPAALAHLREVSGDERPPRQPLPDFILLDLNMPGEDGRSLLMRLKLDERLRRIPVVVMSTSANPKDLEYCYANGAAGYIVKPVDLGKYRSSLEKLADYWLRAVTLPPVRAVS